MPDTPTAAAAQPQSQVDSRDDVSLQKEMVEKLDDLMQALANHPDARKEHITRATWAPSKRNPVEYLHEFVDSTKKMVLAIDPKVPKEKDTEWIDALGRCHFLNLIVNDNTGKAAMMFGFSPDTVVEFGDEIKAKAHALSLRASKEK